MNAKRALNLSLLIILSLSFVNAQGDKKLLGAWKVTMNYETHYLEVVSDSQLIVDGETHSYTLSDSNIVADYQTFPYTFRGADLFITADGIEYKFIRTGDVKKKVSGAEVLQGTWENRDEYGMHKVTFHSDSQLEYDGEWVGYAIEDNAIVVDYEKYLFKMEGEDLMVKWPGEPDYRKYTRLKD
jgi:hypothetical protein